MRSSSSAFPPNLDLRASMQYRALPGQQTAPLRVPQTGRASTFGSTAFSSGFQSAPLSAPVDFHLPRTPANIPPEFETPQMSAPMAPPSDFSTAYNQGRDTSQHIPRSESRYQQQLHPGGPQREEQHQPHSAGFMRNDEYVTGEKRKRSYTVPEYN